MIITPAGKLKFEMDDYRITAIDGLVIKIVETKKKENSSCPQVNHGHD